MTMTDHSNLKQEIINVYNTNKSLSDVINKFNLSKQEILELLMDSNIIPKLGYRKYKLNQHYFDIIDDEHKAYWLGLLYSDGYNNEDGTEITLELQECDKYILDKLNLDIESNRPLYRLDRRKRHPTWKVTYRLSISSKYMSFKLKKLGVMQAKSLILKFPTEEQVPSNLINHFIRGMWDGNGGFYKYDDVCIASLTSSLSVCESVQNVLTKTLNIVSHIYEKEGCYELRINGVDNVSKFAHYLYDNSTICLDRKFHTASSIYEHNENNKLGKKTVRGWGGYYTIFEVEDKSVCFKKLVVDPGHQLSLQYHNNRNEFWYIADKNAYYQMTINDKVEITHGIRTFNIIRGQLHTILNMSSLPLIIYETQTGYCDESDIVRVKDPYANCRSVP